jgi:hypothetical protein
MMYAKLKTSDNNEMLMSIGYFCSVSLFSNGSQYSHHFATLKVDKLESLLEYLQYFSIELVIVHYDQNMSYFGTSDWINKLKNKSLIPVIVVYSSTIEENLNRILQQANGFVEVKNNEDIMYKVQKVFQEVYY